MDKKKIVFLTGTRADFGKMKPIIQSIHSSDCLKSHIFATGMHMLPKYGVTAHEILKCGFDDIYFYNNQAFQLGMDISLANTIHGFSCYIKDLNPDFIVVHGDRPETLAGAIVGSFNNIRVGHIEGGEVSGTIDGLIRHSVTKLSHIHFVKNQEAKNRLIQMGESDDTVFIIGSPEIDIMLSDDLPSFEKTRSRYEIPFNEYGILIYHPVTTEVEQLPEKTKQVVDAIIESELKYIVISPNNDMGSEIITKEYRRFKTLSNIKIFPSIRFEYFLTLFKNSKFIVGNSSAGVRESPIYGVPTINIGTRQHGRNSCESIFDVTENKNKILNLIQYICEENLRFETISKFGDGKSVERFINIMKDSVIWNVPLQKEFMDSRKKQVKRMKTWRKVIEEMLQASHQVEVEREGSL